MGEQTEETLAAVVAEQDWRALDPVHMTVYCRCGGVWRSHHKLVTHEDGTMLRVTENPCPGCGKRMGVYRGSSDPELWTVTGGAAERTKGEGER